AVLARLGFVHDECAAAVLLTVQPSDRILGLLVVGHLDKAESLRSTCVAVHDYLCGLDGSVRCEQLFERGLGHVVSQVADIQFLTHQGLPKQERSWARQARQIGAAPAKANWGRRRVERTTRRPPDRSRDPSAVISYES